MGSSKDLIRCVPVLKNQVNHAVKDLLDASNRFHVGRAVGSSTRVTVLVQGNTGLDTDIRFGKLDFSGACSGGARRFAMFVGDYPC